METYFQIRYEFDRDAVHRCIAETLEQGRSGYICVADGNVLTHVHRNEEYRSVVDGALFSICDSGWVPVYLRWLYGIKLQQYCGARIFQDIVTRGGYRMAFLGTDEATLVDLCRTCSAWNPAVADMLFVALPYCAVEEFDYPAIAAELNAAEVDIIWVALGAPKQDYFMRALTSHLPRGVALGVGAVFNFYSGRICRAPQWIIALKLEFLYRVFREPRKQLARCWQILTTLPAAFRREMKSRAEKQPTPNLG